jgi:hypothetical protein
MTLSPQDNAESASPLKMLRLTTAEQLMHATVRIECTSDNGAKSFGTGFFYRFLDDGKTHVPAIVTNKHVVCEARQGVFWLTCKGVDNTPQVGTHHRLEIDSFSSLWIPHPDPEVDLAVLPVGAIMNAAGNNGFSYFYVTLDKNILPSKEAIDSFQGCDEILMVGYPNALWDSVNNLPIFRAGVTATHPKYSYEGRPLFLIDCACFPGSSGSPVFIYDRNGWRDRSQNLTFEERVLLLGVLYAGPAHIVHGEVQRIEIPELAEKAVSVLRIPNNLGFVIKAEKLNDFEAILNARRGTSS